MMTVFSMTGVDREVQIVDCAKPTTARPLNLSGPACGEASRKIVTKDPIFVTLRLVLHLWKPLEANHND